MKSGRSKTFDEPITKEDVETVVKRALGLNVKLINYHSRMYSQEKVGFLGMHRYLIVTIQRGNRKDSETVTFFLKHIPYDIHEQASVIQESKAFYKETMFYKIIAPELTSGKKDASWYAQCYLVKDDVLIFEDLKFKDYSNKPKLLDMTAVKSALIALAKLHAASMIADARLGRTLKELFPEVFEECLFVRKGKFGEMFRTGVDVSVAIAKYLGLDATALPKVMNRIFDGVVASKTRRNAVCHGDVWSNNLMFDNSQPLPNCILVDFQLLRYAPMMTDVAQLMYLTTQREFRDKNLKNLLALYHNTLCVALKDNKEIKLPTFDEIAQDYKTMSFVGLITAATIFPIILVDPKVCVELTKNSDGFAKLFFHDRVDLVMSFMKDSNFNVRISEIIRELVERSDEFLSVQV